MKTKVSGTVTLIGGALLLLFCIPHSFLGYPAITTLLIKDDTATETITNVQNIWIFSEITMLMAGVWATMLGFERRKGDARNKNHQLLLGTGITLFGLITWSHPFPNWGMSIFILPGVLILIPALFKTK